MNDSSYRDPDTRRFAAKSACWRCFREGNPCPGQAFYEKVTAKFYHISYHSTPAARRAATLSLRSRALR